MTCVVGIETKEGVWMGADSLVTSGWEKDYEKTAKVFRSEPFIIGGAGAMRATQLLRYTLKVMPPNNEPDLYPYMVGELVSAIRKCLSEGGYSQKENEVETARNSTWLVGVHGQLFHVTADFCVSRSARGYEAIGSGREYALGVLYALAAKPHRERIEMALAAAIEHNAACAEPYVVLEP